jgi:hypothetical protein
MVGMSPSEFGPERHPDLELLLSRGSGLLDAETAAAVDAHIRECALCRLEMKRAARFDELDHDDEAAAEADWDVAAGRLDAAWCNRSRPRRRNLRWLAPVAAAAAVALIAISLGDRALRDPLGGVGDTVRGTPAAGPVILADGPKGEVADPPARFTWASAEAFDSFVLEVFTEDLGTVLLLDGLDTDEVVLSGEQQALFAPDTTYFWHVEGFRGLTAAEASATVWFRIAGEQGG